jgi:very-short-patch-repair endonuclease
MPYQQPPPSPIERSFWNAARKRIPDLEREVPMGRYRVDFLVRRHKVVIELYGFKYHHTKKKLTSDAQRERFIQRRGYHILRFTGTEVYKDVDGCVQEVVAFLRTLPDRTSAERKETRSPNPMPSPFPDTVRVANPRVRPQPDKNRPKRLERKTKGITDWIGLKVWQIWVLGGMFLLVMGTITTLVITVLRSM